MQTYLVTSYKEDLKAGAEYASAGNETWSFFPDDDPPRSWYPGDSRAALAPFLAFRDLRNKDFKWLFYGDDDTLFFLSAAKHLVQGLDPNVPYILTGKQLRLFQQRI